MWSMHYMITLVIKLLFHFFVVDFLSSSSFSLISGIQSLFQTHKFSPRAHGEAKLWEMYAEFISG